MHTVIDAFNCRFVFLGSSLDHVWISDFCVRFCTLYQSKHHASSPAPRTEETCSWASPHHVCQVYRLADTQFSASSEAADIVTLRSIVLLVIFWLTVLVGCCSWETASCAYPPCCSSQASLFHCNSLTPCRNEILAALRQSPCLEHSRQHSCPSLTRQIWGEATRRVHVHRAWETRNGAPCRSWNECRHQENHLLSRCEGEGYDRCEDGFFFKFANEVAVML